MKRNALLSLLLLTMMAGIAYAQGPNLVPNGDFETVTSYPTGQGQISLATGWNNCNGYTGWPYGSPDLFHTSGTGNAQLPNTVSGSVNPYSGNSIIGFITHNGYVSNFREYSSVRLTSPLEVGQTYSIDFYLTNGYANWYGKRGSNNIGVALTLTPPAQNVHDPISIVPQMELTTIVHHTNWHHYQFLYTPTQPFEYLTIGNFRDDASTSLQDFTTGQNFAYYFMDMVSVTKIVVLPAETMALQQADADDALSLTWHMPADADGYELQLERSTDALSFETVQDYGITANAGADMYYSDATALPGYQYHYRLRSVTLNGDVQYSPVLAATFGQAEAFTAGEVYPNPSSERFSLQFSTPQDGNLVLDLIDASGKLVHHVDQAVAAGFDDPTFELPAQLAAGIYQARFAFEGQTFTKRVVVSKTF